MPSQGETLAIVVGRPRWRPVVLRQCCWCKAIQDGEGDAAWVRAEGLPLLANAKHGVCPDCSERLVAEARARKVEVAS